MSVSHVDEGTLHAYLDGELSPAEAQGVDAHIAQCPACRERLEEERALIARAGELLALAAPPARELPPFRAGDVKAPTRLWWQVRLPLAWAATIALALGIGTYLGETGRAPLAPTPLVRPNEIAERPAQNPTMPDTVVAEARQRRAERSIPRSQPSAPAAVGMIAEAEQQKRAQPVAALRARDEALAARKSRPMAAKAVAPPAPAPARPEALRLGDRGYVFRDGPIAVDSARLVLGRDPLVVADLPVRAMYRGQLIGYSGVVIVEQALDSTTVIDVVNGRPSPEALQEIVVTGAGRGVPARADTANAAARRFPQRAADSLAALPKERALSLPTGDFLVDVRGPVSADSLAALRRLLRPLRP